jgi:hypothetical protein
MISVSDQEILTVYREKQMDDATDVLCDISSYDFLNYN